MQTHSNFSHGTTATASTTSKMILSRIKFGQALSLEDAETCFVEVPLFVAVAPSFGSTIDRAGELQPYTATAIHHGSEVGDCEVAALSEYARDARGVTPARFLEFQREGLSRLDAVHSDISARLVSPQTIRGLTGETGSSDPLTPHLPGLAIPIPTVTRMVP